jgi:hypothetical protein
MEKGRQTQTPSGLSKRQLHDSMATKESKGPNDGLCIRLPLYHELFLKLTGPPRSCWPIEKGVAVHDPILVVDELLEIEIEAHQGEVGGGVIGEAAVVVAATVRGGHRGGLRVMIIVDGFGWGWIEQHRNE